MLHVKELHCVKYQNVTLFPGVEILWKGTVSTEFRVNRLSFRQLYIIIL